MGASGLANDGHQTGTTAIAESDRIHLLLRSQLTPNAEYSRLPRRGLMVMMAFLSSSSGPQSATASEITSGGNRKLAKTEIARGEVTGSVSRHPQSTNATAPSGVPPYGPASVASSVNQFERNEISGWADRGHEADGVLARSGVVRSGCP